MRRMFAVLLMLLMLAGFACAEAQPVAIELALAMAEEIPEMQDVQAYADTGVANGAIWKDERSGIECILFVHTDEAQADIYSLEHTTKKQSVRAAGCCTITLDSAMPLQDIDACMQAMANVMGVEAEVPMFILDVNTKKYHKPDCASVGEMKDSNKLPYNGERDRLEEYNYEPCKRCKP